MTDFEDILDDVGTFGPFQVRLFVLVSLFETPAAWAIFLPVFIQKMPEWSCLSSKDAINSSDVNVSTKDAEQYCGEGSRYCDSSDDVLFNTTRTTIKMEFDLCGEQRVQDLFTPLQMVGVLFGACFFGQLADMFGRRRTLYVAYSLLLLMMFATAFTPTWQLYMTCRCFTGFFFGGKHRRCRFMYNYVN